MVLEAVRYLGRDEAEAVKIFGENLDDENLEDVEDNCADPITQILEVERISSIDCNGPFVAYENEAYLSGLYGRVCMVISVDHESRKTIEL